MKTILFPLLATLSSLLRSRAVLHLEILALRQQLAMVARRNRKLRFRCRERLFWIWLYRIWLGCLETLAVFKADTLVRWHRQGFRRYWTWKSRHTRGGRPLVSRDVRALIRRLSRENPLWGAPRVHGELQMLGIDVSQTTVAKYMLRHRNPPSQTWRTLNYSRQRCQHRASMPNTSPSEHFRLSDRNSRPPPHRRPSSADPGLSFW